LKTEILKDYEYTGVFNDFYSRWWMPLIEKWWEENINNEVPFRNLTSQQKVELLSSKLKMTLSPIEKTDKSKSYCFWSVCKATLQPIDTIDGFIISNQDDLFPWQEKEYVCIEEALRPTKIDLWKGVSSLEKNRLQLMKDYFDEREQRVRK